MLCSPTHAYNDEEKKVWERELDIYGSLRKGDNEFVPFLYQGQYVDEETGDVYNRFRYYSAESGMYLNQDPISIQGGLNVYAYVHDTNSWVDIFGLSPITNTVDFTGHPDLYQGAGKNIVTIKLTGDRGSDFTRAFKEAGINKTDATGYTWHHVADFNSKTGISTMQLVKTSTHEASLPHKGSAGQFADHFGVKYDTYEAKVKAFEQGWRDEPKKKAPKKTGCH